MKIAIVGIFFDGYYDLWEDFLELFGKFWPDCPYPKYIVDNLKNLEFEKNYNFNVIHAGETAEYSRKVQTALEEIDADYYYLILEDFFIGKPITEDPFPAALAYMNKFNVEYYSMPLKEFQSEKKKCNIERLKANKEYTVGCQPAVWSKDFLKKCIGNENYNAWIFEGIYAKSEQAHTKEFLDKLCIDYSNPLHFYHGALQGKILPSTYLYFQSIGYEFKNKREVLSKEEYNKYLRKKMIKKCIPVWMQIIIKKYIKTNSVIERYDEEIHYVMNKMGIH